MKLVAGDSFGQIFITDTNRDHLDKILKKIEGDYKLFEVDNGMVNERGRMLMKRNNTEQVGDVIRQLLRQQGLETP